MAGCSTEVLQRQVKRAEDTQLDKVTIGVSSESEDDQTNDEKMLLNYLMRNYDRSIRPVKNASNPVVIRLGITLTQIFDLVSISS